MSEAMGSKLFIHESAYVDDGATIGADSKVWHFCHVMSGGPGHVETGRDDASMKSCHN